MKALTSLFALVCAAPLLCSAGTVNINSADARTLSKELKGIGLARAAAIVAYRNEHGPFKSADELMLVKGIAQKVIDQNRANIKLEGGRSPASASKEPAAKQPGGKATLAADSAR